MTDYTSQRDKDLTEVKPVPYALLRYYNNIGLPTLAHTSINGRREKVNGSEDKAICSSSKDHIGLVGCGLLVFPLSTWLSIIEDQQTIFLSELKTAKELHRSFSFCWAIS